jgi:hypothetical protein
MGDWWGGWSQRRRVKKKGAVEKEHEDEFEGG